MGNINQKRNSNFVNKVSVWDKNLGLDLKVRDYRQCWVGHWTCPMSSLCPVQSNLLDQKALDIGHCVIYKSCDKWPIKNLQVSHRESCDHVMEIKFIKSLLKLKIAFILGLEISEIYSKITQRNFLLGYILIKKIFYIF